ncbi:MAG: hypothetical protein EXR66_04035 [Dehalococcoidia bacterium]|nr:hypothetical protein [Dehalococcoidia bacterium]
MAYAVRLLPWAPEYGTSMQFDADGVAPNFDVDTAIEQARWAAVTPSGERASAVQVIDGVRRVEAHAFADGPAGEPLFGLFGSFGVGAVRCAGECAWVLDDALRIERRYFQAGGEAREYTFRVGGHELRFAPEQRSEASANGLVDALNRAMLDAESLLADTLALDESALTLVDGPLRNLRGPGRRVVGYVKRVMQWYVSPLEQRLLSSLRTGERTPLFRVTDPEDAASPGRYCWYLRIAELPANFHPLSGIVRLEVPGALPLSRAVALADQSSLSIPRLASTPARDPRAPQNLVPVGALEATLTHRLGDREWIRRLLTTHLAAGSADGLPAPAPAPIEVRV